MPPGVGVSGLESDGGDRFFCGGGSSGKVRAVRRPRRGSTVGRACQKARTRRSRMSAPGNIDEGSNGSNPVLRVLPLHVRSCAESGITGDTVQCRSRAKSRHSAGGSDGVHRAWRPPENMLTRLLSGVARYQGRSLHAYAVSTQGGEISLSLRFVCLRADAIEFALRTASSTEGEVALPTSDGPQSSSSPHPSRA